MKSIVKKILLNLSYLYSRNSRENSISQIYFHDVVLENGNSYDSIELLHFKDQMKFLSENGYKTLTFNDLDLIEKDINYNQEKTVLITFDDGYYSNFSLVFPIMKELNLKFNIFLEVGAIDKKVNYLTWDMIKEMYDSDIVDFGAHTYNHVDSRYINKSNFNLEIIDSNKEILEKTGINVYDFCFPFGMYDDNIVRFLDESKIYKRLYTSDGIKVIKKKNLTLYGRVGIENEDNNTIFISKLNGCYNFYYRVIRILKNIIKGEQNEVFRKG